MANSEAYEKGQQVRREMMGDELVEKLATTVYADPVMKKFGDYATEAVFGLLWTRWIRSKDAGNDLRDLRYLPTLLAGA